MAGVVDFEPLRNVTNTSTCFVQSIDVYIPSSQIHTRRILRLPLFHPPRLLLFLHVLPLVAEPRQEVQDRQS